MNFAVSNSVYHKVITVIRNHTIIYRTLSFHVITTIALFPFHDPRRNQYTDFLYVVTIKIQLPASLQVNRDLLAGGI